MTAKERAISIRDRMYNAPYVQETEAKRCALEAVDIILTDLVVPLEFGSFVYKHYEEVKIELNKL